ncbi:MAG: RNA methyltransferase [Prolixibacteraceae bacterium]|nr:RNA methyltransferase [Prolixibacteraceae bacterium]
MISKNKIKFINSLTLKKYRDESGLFIAEGDKIIQELISAGFSFETLILTEKYNAEFESVNCEKIIAADSEIKKISSRETPPGIIAVCKKKQVQFSLADIRNKIVIALDGIQDPGNLGTIIRLASWFGIDNIICSLNTVDCYNPKVIQSTMGAIAHVDIIYTDLLNFLADARRNGIHIFGTFLDGINIYKSNGLNNGIIVFGNEGNGISKEIESIVETKVLIPSFNNNIVVESLNVSMAAAIAISEFKRRSI